MTHRSKHTEIIWGSAAIGEAIGRSERQAFYLMQNGEIPAKKVGGRWCTTRQALEAYFTDFDDPPRDGVGA